MRTVSALLVFTALAALPVVAQHGAAPHGDRVQRDPVSYMTSLDDPARAAWQKPDEVVAALALKPGDVVADIGAGSGYFALRFAPLLPQGRVLAVDVSQPMLDEVGRRATAAGMRNLVPVLGGFDDPRLPAGGVDVIFTCNTWHHIDGRDAYLARVKAALTPGGRVAVVDFHKDSPRGPANMKLARAAVVDEFQRNGFRLAAEHTFLPDQCFLVFTAS